MACSKSIDNKEKTEDRNYSRLTQLVETSVKFGQDNWQKVDDEKCLFLLSNDKGNTWPRTGEYKYSARMEHEFIAGNGFFSFENSGMIITSTNHKKVKLDYQFLNDSTLIISNKSLNPVVQVMFVRR
jgi:hypothetical protein